MNPALETLLLPFRPEGGLVVPARALFLGAVPHPAFGDWPDLVGWQPFRPWADEWERAGNARIDTPAGRYPLVLVLPGKSKDETLAWFALARDHLEPGGRILAALSNTCGAARFEKELQRACGAVESVQKHKCRAFHAVEDGAWDEVTFAAWRTGGLPRELPGTGFIVQAGVFSADHVDPGSELLAKCLPGSLRGRVADFGAGWGFLTESMLRRCPGVTAVDLFEADARALDCARINLAERGGELGFHWHDVTTGVDGPYDAVIMNPPFHQGRETRVDVGRAFLASAAGCLRRGGALHLVANRQLPYEPALERLGFTWREAGGDTTYKLLSATKH